MQYAYEAVTNAGQPKSGVVSAQTLAEVRQQLREQGMFLVKASVLTAGSFSLKGTRSTGGRVSKNDLLNLTSQFAIMAQAGVDVATALEMLASECPNMRLKSALTSVHQRVSAGESISEALRSQSSIFGEAYVASVAAGEVSGKLPVVLARLAQLLRAEIKIGSTLRSMLAYPVILLVVSFTVMLALIFFVLPTFADVFGKMGIELPALTQFLLDVSGFFTGHLWLVALLGGGLGGTGWFFLKHPRGQRLLDQMVLQIPILKVITRNLNVGRSFRLLGTMVDSGVPLLESLGMCEKSIRNRVYRDLFREIREDVINGRNMSGALARSSVVPPAASSMVATGERTGSLGSVLQLLGEHYENEAETRFKDLATFLEPVMVIFVGGIVATVVLSLVLPMFDFAQIAESK